MTKSSASCCSGLEPDPLVVLVGATAVVITGGVPAVVIVRILPGADPTGDDDPGNPAKKKSKKKFNLCETYAWLNLRRSRHRFTKFTEF